MYSKWRFCWVIDGYRERWRTAENGLMADTPSANFYRDNALRLYGVSAYETGLGY